MGLRHGRRALRGRTRTLPGARDEASSLPALPAVSATATACQGRGRDGRVPFPGRQLPRPADRGPTTSTPTPSDRQRWRYCGELGGAPPGKSAPRPSPLQAAADTSASSPPVDPWGVEAPGELGGGEPLKLLAWTGRR